MRRPLEPADAVLREREGRPLEPEEREALDPEEREPPEPEDRELLDREEREPADPEDRELLDRDERVVDAAEPLVDTPDAAPRTIPRAAPNTTSPAFIAPARPYTAPRRIRFRARGETTAAVAATAIPTSLSIMSSRATFPPGAL